MIFGPYDFVLQLKIPFLKIFKIIVESSLIAHSIGNFIPKNLKLTYEPFKFEFQKSEKILPRDSSNDGILKILDIYLEN